MCDLYGLAVTMHMYKNLCLDVLNLILILNRIRSWNEIFYFWEEKVRNNAFSTFCITSFCFDFNDWQRDIIIKNLAHSFSVKCRLY